LPDQRPPHAWPDDFVRSRADRDALLVLAHLQRMIPKELHALAWQDDVRSASRCLEAVRNGEGSAGDRSIALEVDPRRVEERVRRLGDRFVTPMDEEYPQGLLHLHDPPAWLFVRGRSLSEVGTAVAVVGARLCSPYGRDAGVRMGALLAEAGVTVISGAALGVDGAAHEGALGAGGHTVAVLGSGLDRPHPQTNRQLIERIGVEGTLVSEYPPGAVAQPRWFPARNRIIAGLAEGVIVVEGAARSGSLQTAEYAGEGLGRQVMAVPGPIDSPLSAAPHGLIRAGAALVADADDVLDALGLFGTSKRQADDAPRIPPALAGTPEGRLLAVLSGRPASIEDLAKAAGIDLPAALVALSALELRGMVRADGGRYRYVPPKSKPSRKRDDRQASLPPAMEPSARPG
jgi:DNA processing protein